MILEHIVQCTTDSHRARDGIVGLGARDRATRTLVHFINSTHIQGLASARVDLLDQVAIAIRKGPELK